MFNQKTLTTTALVWVPLAIIFTGSIMLAYGIGQQIYRQSLNDPQIQVVDEATRMIAAGQTVQSLVPTERIDIATNLSPFIIFYDDSGKVVLGSGTFNGATPTPPAGIFDNVKKLGEERLTWQPQRGVRIATVVKKTTSGYVLAGRNMSEVENRIRNLGLMAMFTWTLGLGLSLAAALAIAHARTKKA